MSSVALCLVWCSLEEGFKFGYNSPRIPQARLTPTRARTFGVLLAPESKATTLGLTERVLPLFWAWGSREVMPRFMHRPCALSVIRLPFMYSSAIQVGLVIWSIHRIAFARLVKHTASASTLHDIVKHEMKITLCTQSTQS